MNAIEFIKTAFIEWTRTLSSKTSFLSSKRLERFFVFSNMLAITDYFLIKSIYYSEISAVDLMIVTGGWLGYAGFTLVRGEKNKIDKPKEE